MWTQWHEPWKYVYIKLSKKITFTRLVIFQTDNDTSGRLNVQMFNIDIPSRNVIVDEHSSYKVHFWVRDITGRISTDAARCLERCQTCHGTFQLKESIHPNCQQAHVQFWKIVSCCLNNDTFFTKNFWSILIGSTIKILPEKIAEVGIIRMSDITDPESDTTDNG